jgi:hypothetical protein
VLAAEIAPDGRPVNRFAPAGSARRAHGQDSPWFRRPEGVPSRVGGENALIDLDIKRRRRQKIIVHIQYKPLKQMPIHVDFYLSISTVHRDQGAARARHPGRRRPEAGC